MIRRISTKWVVTVLAAVLLPFLGFAWYVNGEMRARHWESVRYYLQTMVSETQDRVDTFVRERQLSVELVTTTTPFTEWTVADLTGDQGAMASTLRGVLNRFVAKSREFDLLLAINERGELVVSNDKDVLEHPLATEVLERLQARDYSREDWFKRAMRGEVVLVDHHVSDLLPHASSRGTANPTDHHIGFALPIKEQLNPENRVGVVFALLNFKPIQAQVERTTRPRISGADEPDLYYSVYSWLWQSDGDTILAHPNADLYTKRVSQPPIGLPELTRAALSSDFGMYPEYVFNDVRRNAAYKHCAGPDKGGFGWIVGVGIDNTDVTGTVVKLQDLLTKATALVLLTVVLFTIVIARRTTRPIVELREHTRRVAAGDLDARVAVTSGDELGMLASAFNEMTRELKENREKLIKAEKETAWREMARQVAHEIKNPLTPIALSINLLRRARDEKSPEFDSILDRTTDLIQRQVENMRKIASDFAAFAGARKPQPVVFELDALVDEVLDLNYAWAAEAKVRIDRRGTSGKVRVDKDELRRVILNVVSNAFEAMPAGGEFVVTLGRVERSGKSWLAMEFRDSGVGLSDTVRARLFEPYFTTRTHGTGLGLAICKRLVEEMGGTISLEARPENEGRGTIARLELPEHTENAA